MKNIKINKNKMFKSKKNHIAFKSKLEYTELNLLFIYFYKSYIYPDAISLSISIVH